MQFSIQNLGLTVPTQQKSQGFFNSVGTSMGMGRRHEPLDVAPWKNPGPHELYEDWRQKLRPGVGEYDLAKNAEENSNPKWKFGKSDRDDPFQKRGGEGDQLDINLRSYTQGEKTRHKTKPKPSKKEFEAMVELLREKTREKQKKPQVDGDLGPGQYTINKHPSGPIFSFGSRFSSSVRNRDYLRTTKVDGPGPGSYKLPGSVQVKSRHPAAEMRPTFGTAERRYIDIPQNVPSPARYRKEKFTEASHSYSFSQDFPKIKETKQLKEAMLPGPTSYNNMKEMKNQMTLAKSMLGGSLEEKPHPETGNPLGPAAYQQNPIYSIPGFRLVPKTNEAKLSNDDKEKLKIQRDVGPHSYYPKNPSLYRTDNLHKNSIGKSERQDLVFRSKVPGPGNYVITGDFDKGKEQPKFHFGNKTTGFMGKNLDMPGPGEYETDVIPIHHSNVAHFIGTSVRSDLGVGKAYMYPGPGEYEAQIDSTMDPRIRIAGTFGTQKKDTVVKKSFAPGPGSYDLPQSVGLMPQYLRTEENRAAKQAQEQALRARLEI